MVKVIMHQTKITKNTVRYDEPGEGRTLRNIYVDKDVLNKLSQQGTAAEAFAGYPASLTVTLEVTKS